MSVSTVSFDVFDTVLTRIWAEPRDLFVRLGQVLQDSSCSNMDPVAFASERVSAEASARNRNDSREVTIVEIYRVLAGTMGWTESTAAAAVAAELALESEGIRAVPGAGVQVDKARLGATQVAFLSDIYLPSELLGRWLKSAGLLRENDLLLVSGEQNGGKGTGELFKTAQRQTSAPFSEWSHSGDNRYSDFEVPQRLGIACRLDEGVHLTPRERVLRGKALFAEPWRSLLAGAARLGRLSRNSELPGQRSQTLWEIGSSVAGPLFWGYTEWCLREAEERGIEDLYFLARGGQIFYRIAQEISVRRPLRVRLHYLHSSRIAFSGIADSGNPNYLRKLANAPLPFHSFRQAIANLGIEETPELRPPGLGEDEWGRNLGDTERRVIADWLLGPEMRPRIDAALAKRTRQAREYLRASGISNASRIGLVDTGWMGTIQRNIEFLLCADGKQASVTGFYLGLTPIRTISCTGDMLAYTNRFRPLALRRETTHLIMLELMAQGSHGPLVGFEEIGGAVAPRFGPASSDVVEEVRYFQESILAFVRAACDVADLALFPQEDLARVTIEAYHQFFRLPTLPEALALGRMPHANQMLEQSHSELSPEMSTRSVLAAITSFRKRPPGWWLQGQAVQGNSPLIHAYLALKRLKWWIQKAATGCSD